MMPVMVDVLSWLCLGAGSLLGLISAFGLLRLPDVYSRSHAAGLTDTLGAALLLAGLVLQSGANLVSVKLVMVLGFFLLTGPMTAHALVKTAWLHGVEPELVDKESDDHRPD